CGYGKTLGIADYIAQNKKDGFLYVAERIEQLENMNKLLISRDVDPASIGVYISNSEELRELRNNGEGKPIALVTHARLMTDAPEKFLLFNYNGRKNLRSMLVCDESVTPLLIFRIPRLVILGFLAEMKLSLGDCGKLSEEEIEISI